jgi:hypothetical protein
VSRRRQGRAVGRLRRAHACRVKPCSYVPRSHEADGVQGHTRVEHVADSIATKSLPAGSSDERAGSPCTGDGRWPLSDGPPRLRAGRYEVARRWRGG